MSMTIAIEPSLSLQALQSRLRTIEALHGPVRALHHADGPAPSTLAIVEEGHAPSRKIGLVLGAGDQAKVPTGSVLVCLGEVYVGGALRSVAAFREVTADAGQDGLPTEASPGDARRRRIIEQVDWLALMPDMKLLAVPGRTKGGKALVGRGATADGTTATARRSAPAKKRPAAVAAKSAATKAAGTKAASTTRRAAPAKNIPAIAARQLPAASVADQPRAATAARKTEAPVATLPALDPREYRVWFGTNRKPVDAANAAKGFSSERDTTVHYGHCDVLVPRSHKMGSIGKFHLIRWISGNDDRLRIRRLAALSDDDFWIGVRSQIEKAAPGARHAVIFIHGYRVSFKDAALRAAQIGFDLGIQGAVGFFSWPSKGTFLGYAADGGAIEGSEAAIANFLVDFARRSDAEAVHVIAHSMGNRGLLRAANRIVADAVRRAGCRFGQFILAAPDVDAGNFRDLAEAYKTLAQRTTLYVSSKDLAVKLSRWLRSYARVGFHPPVTVVDGIDTVSVANVDLTLLGHGYVAEARPVLEDIERLISTNQSPPRFGQEAATTPDGDRYWIVRA